MAVMHAPCLSTILPVNNLMTKCLHRYIAGMLASTDFTWHWHTGAAPWEEKVAELLPFISSVEARQEIWDVLFRQLTPYLLFFRSSVILEAVKVAPVPWSSTVEKLYETRQKLQQEEETLCSSKSKQA